MVTDVVSPPMVGVLVVQLQRGNADQKTEKKSRGARRPALYKSSKPPHELVRHFCPHVGDDGRARSGKVWKGHREEEYLVFWKLRILLTES